MESTRRMDLRTLRTALGLTQLDLCIALGITPRTVYHWENGRPISRMGRSLLAAYLRQPEVLGRLAAALGPTALVDALGELGGAVLR